MLRPYCGFCSDYNEVRPREPMKKGPEGPFASIIIKNGEFESRRHGSVALTKHRSLTSMIFTIDRERRASHK